jgi:hypothetical protein
MAVENSSANGDHARNTTLTSMAMGYFRSRVLCAAAQLGVPDALGDNELSVDELAVRCGVAPSALHRLLRALASIGVVAETRSGWFDLTPFGQRLRKDDPNSEWAAIIFWGDLLADSWSYLTECIRAGDTAMSVRPENVPSRWSLHPNAGEIFRAVMGTEPVEDCLPIVRAWDSSKYHNVADLGGGGGALIAAILHANPNLRGVLVDRQETIETAVTRITREGLAARCDLVAADLCQEVPAGADVYILKNVLHGYKDREAIEILLRCRSVVPPQGRLLVIEFVLPDVIGHANLELETRLMSDLNMMLVTGGKERTAVEWKTLLDSARFAFLSSTLIPGGTFSLIEAVPLS